mmetsp:Transcript_9944/g.14470  ORF Transcript_9944/g.14470 Transcript_9944/m.14470 type:complete len:129 (-) Transcript_9944:71-457(-)
MHSSTASAHELKPNFEGDFPFNPKGAYTGSENSSASFPVPEEYAKSQAPYFDLSQNRRPFTTTGNYKRIPYNHYLSGHRFNNSASSDSDLSTTTYNSKHDAKDASLSALTNSSNRLMTQTQQRETGNL